MRGYVRSSRVVLAVALRWLFCAASWPYEVERSTRKANTHRSRSLPFAEVSIWLACHDDIGPFEAVLAPLADRIAGYLVTESIPTDYMDPPPSEVHPDYPSPAASS